MSDIVYGIKITGEASGAKKAFEETGAAQRKLSDAEKDNARSGVEIERANEMKTAALGRLRLAVLAVGAAMLAMGRSSINAAVEAERAQNRLTAVINATGGAAGVARGEYDRMADSLAEMTQFDDESLRGAMATLLKFGNIHGDVFRNAIKLSADLAAYLGTDVPGAAQMIGKSLQSPTEGLRAMEMQFGKLTAAEEKNITKLVEQGRAVEAQNAILELWRKKVGGTAELMNTGLSGAVSGLSKGWNELLENFGKTANSAGLVERSIRGLTAAMRDLENVGKPGDPMLAQQHGLENINNRIETLTRDLAERRAMRRAYGGADVADDPSFAGMQARIDELRAMAQQRARGIQVMGMAGDPSTYDARDLRLRQTPAITLGGDNGAAARERAAAERAKEAAQVRAGIGESLAMQREIMDEASALGVKFLQQQEDKRIALEKEAEAVRDTLNPWNAYAREVERLRALHEKGAISQREFGDAVAAEARKIGSAYEDIAAKGTQSFDELKNAIEGWGQDLSRELARGEVSLRSFGRLLEELLAMQIQRRFMQPFLNAGTEFLSDLFNTTGVQSASQMAAFEEAGAYIGGAAPFHTGGIAGLEDGARRYVHPAYFERAPRLHSGGLAGDEVPAILKRGEGVFTREQMRAMGGANVTVKVINETGVPSQGQASAPRVDASGIVVDLVLRRLSTDAGAREQLGGLLAGPRNY